MVLDVADAAAVRALKPRLAKVDVLVNNAGIDYDTDETALSADLERVRAIFETNFFGAWSIAQAVAPGMRSRGWGRIVNVSSGAGSLTTIGGDPPESRAVGGIGRAARARTGSESGFGRCTQ